MFRKQVATLIILAVLVISGVAAIAIPESKHKNLKVLPQDISEPMLDSIMESYSKALGVNCKFCHSSYKGFPDSLDYAADTEPMKENARKMMRMVIDINKNNFYFDSTARPEYLKVVTCKTCHRGEPFPAE